MRIVEVTYSWPAETFIVRHALALHESPYPMDLLIASRSPGQGASASIQDCAQVSFPVVSLPNFDYFSRVRKLCEAIRILGFRPPQGKWPIRDKANLRTIAAMQPDLVHFHFGSLATMMAHYPRALGIPYSVSLRGSDIQVMPLHDERYAADLCQVLSEACGVHAVSEEIARLARHECPDLQRIVVIRTCVPLPEQPGHTPETQLGLRFVSVGRLTWHKAYPDLVRAMVHLPNASLDIVGEGPEREFLLYLIHQLNLQSRTRLLGKLPFHEFAGLLERATAFVQSSIAEGFSNALAEAMALGKAVFATAVGGTTEIIEDGKNGIIIPTGDPSGIAQKLMLAADADLMARVGQAARQTAEQHFSIAGHAQQFYEFYQGCINAWH